MSHIETTMTKEDTQKKIEVGVKSNGKLDEKDIEAVNNFVEKAKMKGKCSNCGVPMEQESNKNWEVYCNKPECFEVMKKKLYEK